MLPSITIYFTRFTYLKILYTKNLYYTIISSSIVLITIIP